MMTEDEGNAPPRQGDTHAAAPHSTAAAIAKQYDQQFSPSDNPDKRPNRPDDGHTTSGQYIRVVSAEDATTPRPLQIDYHHRLEDWLGRRPARWLLGKLAAGDGASLTTLERIIETYRDPAASWFDRLKYWPAHLFIDWMRGDTDVKTFRHRLAEHRPTVRGLVIVARSIARYGLGVPQRFVAPLFAVWNFTNRCNLACRHCYQDSDRKATADELALDEKLDLMDQIGRGHMPMVAFSGGEPTLSPDLLPVLQRAKRYSVHTTIATNGTTITAKLAAELAEAGLRYVEVSLDSVDPARHDGFRGVHGMWEKAVRGAKIVTATEGLRLGIAMCVHQGNFHEVPEMIAFAEMLGASCFAHFNFIPVGRGLKMVSGDITPAQREQLLSVLNKKMQTGGIGVISTAPQLGRVCLSGAALDDGKVTCSHAGSGSGVKARVVAKYLGGCGAGRTYVCIEPNGDVTPCVYLPHRVMGNIRDRTLLEIFDEHPFGQVFHDRSNRLHHCEVCAVKDYCGGCRARADAYFGQLHAGDPGCIFNEKHWQKLVDSGVAVIADSKAPAEDVQLPPMRHGLA